jgi:hypothetical protein
MSPLTSSPALQTEDVLTRQIRLRWPAAATLGGPTAVPSRNSHRCLVRNGFPVQPRNGTDREVRPCALDSHVSAQRADGDRPGRQQPGRYNNIPGHTKDLSEYIGGSCRTTPEPQAVIASEELHKIVNRRLTSIVDLKVANRILRRPEVSDDRASIVYAVICGWTISNKPTSC